MAARQVTTPYPKDGINDHVVHGAATVNPDRRRHQGGAVVTGSSVAAGAHRRAPAAAAHAAGPAASGDGFERASMAAREAEADEFYAELIPPARHDGGGA